MFGVCDGFVGVGVVYESVYVFFYLFLQFGVGVCFVGGGVGGVGELVYYYCVCFGGNFFGFFDGGEYLVFGVGENQFGVVGFQCVFVFFVYLGGYVQDEFVVFCCCYLCQFDVGVVVGGFYDGFVGFEDVLVFGVLYQFQCGVVFDVVVGVLIFQFDKYVGYVRCDYLL